jgi:hypothetical protein
MDLLQNKYRLEDPNRTNDFINRNDNWAEYTLRYVVGYKEEESQNQNCLQEY